MKTYIKIHILLAGILFCSCEDQTLGSIPLDYGDASTIYGDSTRIVQFINDIYKYVPDGFGRIGNAFMACATDEAVYSTIGQGVTKWATGAWGPTYIPDNPLSNSYTGIRATFVYQNQIDPFIDEGVIGKSGREQNMGQIYFLRALLNFQLISRFAGYPIVKEELEANSKISLPRSTYDECVDYIISLCDSAIQILPVTVENSELGRATKGAAMALKARLLLYAASPLYNDPENPSDSNTHGKYSSEKWIEAARASYEIINLEDTRGNIVYRLNNSQYDLFASINDAEIIFNKLDAVNYDLEYLNAPVGLQDGRGGSCPTLNLVDAYGMIDGSSFDWNNTTMAANPFNNRDPRFANDILFNGATYIGNYEVSTYEGGDDKVGIYATKTGFYLRKFMNLNASWWGTTSAVNHSFILFRFAEVLLNYAEAMNEAFGPDNDPEGFGITARQAVAMIRQRAGLTGNIDLIQTVAANNQEYMRRAIQNERQVELAYEEHRYYDLRRWKLAEEVMNIPVYGLRIIKNLDGTFQYARIEVENRVFQAKMYHYPFPASEVNRNPTLEQNPGWN